MARRRTAQERRLHALLAKMEPKVRQAFFDAVSAKQQAVDIKALADAIEAGDISLATRILTLDKEAMFTLTEALRTTVIAGGQSTAALLPITVRAQFGFGGNDRAVKAVEKVTEKLSRILEAEAYDMVTSVISEGISEGIHPRTQALDIAGRKPAGSRLRKGGYIGLDKQRAMQAKKVRSMLTDPDKIGDYFVGSKPRYTTTDRRFDSMVRKAIDSGKALSVADADKISELHKSRLLKNRAETISRTETLNALRTGQHEGFATMVDNGVVTDQQLKKTWRTTKDGRQRDSHDDLDGTTVGFNELFKNERTGGAMMHPGDASHGAGAKDIIQCRCVATYRISLKR